MWSGYKAYQAGGASAVVSKNQDEERLPVTMERSGAVIWHIQGSCLYLENASVFRDSSTLGILPSLKHLASPLEARGQALHSGVSETDLEGSRADLPLASEVAAGIAKGQLLTCKRPQGWEWMQGVKSLAFHVWWGRHQWYPWILVFLKVYPWVCFFNNPKKYLTTFKCIFFCFNYRDWILLFATTLVHYIFTY